MDYIKPEDLPNIDLYMDQVTTFMEDQLASTKRHDDDKILTKTMINNYAKNNLLPSPEKSAIQRSSAHADLHLLFLRIFCPSQTSRSFSVPSQRNTLKVSQART